MRRSLLLGATVLILLAIFTGSVRAQEDEGEGSGEGEGSSEGSGDAGEGSGSGEGGDDGGDGGGDDKVTTTTKAPAKVTTKATTKAGKATTKAEKATTKVAVVATTKVGKATTKSSKATTTTTEKPNLGTPGSWGPGGSATQTPEQVNFHSNKTKYFVLRCFDEVCSENNEVNEEAERVLRDI